MIEASSLQEALVFGMHRALKGRSLQHGSAVYYGSYH